MGVQFGMGNGKVETSDGTSKISERFSSGDNTTGGVLAGPGTIRPAILSMVWKAAFRSTKSKPITMAARSPIITVIMSGMRKLAASSAIRSVASCHMFMQVCLSVNSTNRAPLVRQARRPK